MKDKTEFEKLKEATCIIVNTPKVKKQKQKAKSKDQKNEV